MRASLLLVPVVCGLAFGTGCGASEDSPQVTAAPAAQEVLETPAIEDVGDPTPPWLHDAVQAQEKTGWSSSCVTIPKDGVGPSPVSRPCSENAAWREARIAEAKGRPARSAKARAVAKLESMEQPGETWYLVTYHSRGRGVCFDLYVLPPPGPVGVPVDCEGDEACPRLCLAWTLESDLGRNQITLVAGSVPTTGDALRVVFRDGSTRLFRLAGPLIPDLPGRRAFMVEMGGAAIFRRAELLRGGEVIASAGPLGQAYESRE